MTGKEQAAVLKKRMRKRAKTCKGVL